MKLELERREQADGDRTFGLEGGGVIMMTPRLGSDYWSYRVMLSDAQAVVGFPKFNTIGIGFAVEDADWNTNLPYTVGAEEIFNHISHNKGDDSIDDNDVIEAIQLIKDAATADRDTA